MSKVIKNRAFSFILIIIAAAMIAALLTTISAGDLSRAWRAVLFNYLFFTSASAGLVTWPAIITVCEGEWMGPLERFSRTGFILAIPSLVILVILWAGSGKWVPWINNERHKFWLNNTFVFSRNFILQLIFWVQAFIFMLNRRSEKRIRNAALLIFNYCVTYSITGFDFIMSMKPEWHSMMMGGYFFICGLYTAATAWAFISVINGNPPKESLTDIGRLIVTFSLLTTYTMFSQLLPIWYENLPDEANFMIPLMNLSWRKISFIILFLVYLGPLILFMNRWSKSNYLYAGIVNLFLLAGLWMEKWWLVSSVFENNKITIGWIEFIPALAFLLVIISGFDIATGVSSKSTA